MGLRALLVPRIRLYFCKLRWKLYKKRIRFFESQTDGVGPNVVKYNLSSFNEDAVFGCGARMDILLYPLAALFYPTPNPAKILIIGPRTEDDIFLAKALGLPNTRGLDLFSYSPFIDIGDMHSIPYPDGTFDAVVLGWVLAYSSTPVKAISESKRILKKGGFLAIGWEWANDPSKSDIRGNTINEISELRNIINEHVVFVHNPATKTNHHKSVIFKSLPVLDDV